MKRPVESLGKTRTGFYRLILHQCAFRFIHRDSWHLLELFSLYRDFRQFPFPGTILEQPASMIDAFRIFQGELDALYGPERPLTVVELIEVMKAFYGKR